MRQRAFNFKMKLLIQRIKYYLGIWTLLVKMSLKRSRLYKTEIYSRVFRALMLVAIQALVVESLFVHTDAVVGWSRPEYYLLVGSYNLVNYMGWAIFNVNLRRLQEKIIKGELDYPLLKPSGALFELAFGEFFIDDLVPIISGVILVLIYLLTQPISGIAAIILYFLALLFGLLIWFAIYLLFASLGLLFLGGNFSDIIKSFGSSASAPAKIWGRYEMIFYTLLPVGLVASVPAELLRGSLGGGFLLINAVVAITFTFLVLRFWNFALRKYESGG